MHPDPDPDYRTVQELRGKIHAAIITIKKEEYDEMESQLGQTQVVRGGACAYKYAEVEDRKGEKLGVILARIVRQGNSAAQTMAANLIKDFNPGWLILTGIAGAVPDDDFSLGDVILTTYLHDFSFGGVSGGKTSNEAGGGHMHRQVENFLSVHAVGSDGEILRDLAGFLTDPKFQTHPEVCLDDGSHFRGSEGQNTKVREVLERNFPQGKRKSSAPRVAQGSGANGNMVVKDPTLIEHWQEYARQVTNVETELSGVYEAARTAPDGPVPVLSVRGISDVVGFKRHPDWTLYACQTSSAYTQAILKSGFVDFFASIRGGPHRKTKPANKRAARTSSKAVIPSAQANRVPVSEMQVKLVTPPDLGAESDQLAALVSQKDSITVKAHRVSVTAAACQDHSQLEAIWNNEVTGLGQLIVVLLWCEMGPKTAEGLAGASVSLVERACQSSLVKGARVLVCQYRHPLPAPPTDEDRFAEFVDNLHATHTLCSSLRSNPPPNLRWVDFEQVHQLLPEIHAEIREIAQIRLAKPDTMMSAPADQPTSPIKESGLQDDELALVETVYLNWMVDAHDRLELRGIGGVTPFTTIPLEEVYVALRGVKAPAHERHQARLLHLKELRQELLRARQEQTFESVEDYYFMMLEAQESALRQQPFMPLLSEPDPKNSPEVSVTLAEAFREERWMVILGDPGSGKTTLLRWLARSLAKTLHPQPHERVIVRACHVDATASRNSTATVDLGPARLPVLLRISEYAEALAAARKKLHPLELVNFLGHHTWPNAPRSINEEKLNTLIRKHLTEGTAVVLLDGMDEVTETSQRSDVVHAIDDFIKLWINGRGDPLAARWPTASPPPWKQGGNQIIISSRIAGYHALSIDGPVTQLTVQPMQKSAIGQFCEAWFTAAAELEFPQDRHLAQALGAQEAEGLKKEIFNPKSPQLWELAGNPLLITIIALIYRKRKGRLPTQRSQLYHEAMRILVDEWRSCGIKAAEFIRVLAPLAAKMHEEYSTGYVPEQVMLEVITHELTVIRKPKTQTAYQKLTQEVERFVELLKWNVGLLAERMTDHYGFLHLTFQEYLAGLSLVSDPERAGQALVNRLADPRWREPILLALGHVSTNKHWGPEAQESLLRQILDADDPLSDLIPRGPLLVVRALPEMRSVSESMVQEILSRLLRSYTRTAQGQLASVLRAQIETAVKRLHDSAHQPKIWQGFAQILKVHQPEDVPQAIACAHLIWVNRWSPPAEVVKALLRLQPCDEAHWSWPVTHLVRAMCGPAFEEAKADAEQAVAEWKNVVLQRSPANLAAKEDALMNQLADVQKDLHEINQRLTEEEGQ